MTNDKMMAQISGQGGFIAALDQSGGSTPGALRLYGIPDNAYSGDAEIFRLVHEMRVRNMTAPAFTGAISSSRGVPGKVPSPSDLQTFAIVRFKRGVC